MHRDDSYDAETDVYSIAGVKINRAVFEYMFQVSNKGNLFRLARAAGDNDGIVIIETVAPQAAEVGNGNR